MADEAMSIHLVAGNAIARKLVAAWPACAGGSREEWIRTAIVDWRRPLEDEYRRTAEMLVKTGICRMDGTVDEFVAKYLNALAMKELGIRKK